MQSLKVNGTVKEFPQGVPATLTELLEHLGIKAATVVAEIDGKIVNKEMFSQTRLAGDQSVELIRFAGGG